MKVIVDLNPNNIEFIQYRIDDANSILMRFDIESSDETPTIEIVPSTTKIKADVDAKNKLINTTKQHFKEIMDVADEKVKKIALMKVQVEQSNAENEKFDKYLNHIKNQNIKHSKIMFDEIENPNLKQRFEDKVYVKYKKRDEK